MRFYVTMWMKAKCRGDQDGQNTNQELDVRSSRSSIKEHAETTGHDVQSDDVLILEKGVMNYHKHLFL